MKYLKDKKSRRRGIAIELAVMLMLVMVASSTIIITTTMIQVNKQKESFSDLTELVNDIEKIEYDQIGKAFEEILNDYKIEDKSLYVTENAGTLSLELQQDIYNQLNTNYANYLGNRNLKLIINVTTSGQTLILDEKNEDIENIEIDPETYSQPDLNENPTIKYGLITYDVNGIVKDGEGKIIVEAISEESINDSNRDNAVVVQTAEVTETSVTEKFEILKKTTTNTIETYELTFIITMSLSKETAEGDEEVFEVVFKKKSQIVKNIIEIKYDFSKTRITTQTKNNVTTIHKYEDNNELLETTKIPIEDPNETTENNIDLTDEEKELYKNTKEYTRVYSMNTGDITLSNWIYK